MPNYIPRNPNSKRSKKRRRYWQIQRSKRLKQRRAERRGNRQLRNFRWKFNQAQVVNTSSARSRFTSKTINNGLRVSGYDLVYDMSSVDVDPTSGTFVSIPANPAYWKGTRVAQIATAYSQYRPIYLRFDYFPAVSMQTGGVVTSGTIWGDAPSSNSVQQALTTSNGGKTHTVWSKRSTKVKMGTNLDQNLYNLNGTFEDESNPFIFLAILNDPKNENPIPGYYMCQYTFEFKNPIGDGNEYETERKAAGEIQVSDVWESTSAVLRSESAGFAPGTILTIQVISGVVQFLLKGSRLGVAADLIFDIFKNRNKQVATAAESRDVFLTTFHSAAPTPLGLTYTIGSPATTITSNDFKPILDYYPQGTAYGWVFSIRKDELRNLYIIQPYQAVGYTVEYFTENYPNADLRVLVKEDGTQAIRYSVRNVDQGGQQYYPQIPYPSYFNTTVNGLEVQLMIIHGKPIYFTDPLNYDDEIVGEGNIVMRL